MHHETVWTIERTKKEFPSREAEEKNGEAVDGPGNAPAWAFSLSLLVWGAGQIYNRRWKDGVLLMLLMANFLAFIRLIWINLKPIVRHAEAVEIGVSGFLAVWCFLLLSGLILWLGNAVQAYREAALRMEVPYTGTGNFLLPSLCSILIPGWGQFLNGQPKKGSVFLALFAILLFSVPTILLILMNWSGFGTDFERLFWERFLIGLSASAAAVVVLWPFVVLDAVKVGLDEVKKEPIRKRIEYANNLRRMKGWIGGYFPQVKLTFTLALFLVLSAALGYFFFPAQFYTDRLRNLEVDLSQRKMVMIPGVIDRVLRISGPAMGAQKAEKSADPAEITQTSPSITFQKIQHIEATDEPQKGETSVTY